MKLEIKVNENGWCEYFKINGKKYEKGITGYQVHHKAGNKPLVILECMVDDFILDSEDNRLYLDNLKRKSLFKKIKDKLKK